MLEKLLFLCDVVLSLFVAFYLLRRDAILQKAQKIAREYSTAQLSHTAIVGMDESLAIDSSNTFAHEYD